MNQQVLLWGLVGAVAGYLYAKSTGTSLALGALGNNLATSAASAFNSVF